MTDRRWAVLALFVVSLIPVAQQVRSAIFWILALAASKEGQFPQLNLAPDTLR